MEQFKILLYLITLCIILTQLAIIVMVVANSKAQKLLKEYEDEDSEY